MFRNPRENVTRSSDFAVPSVGRPPTPPCGTSVARNSSPYVGPAATPTPTLAGMKAQLIQNSSAIRGQASIKKASAATNYSRTKPQPNKSILNFFAKSSRPEAVSSNGIDDQELFFQDAVGQDPTVAERDRSSTPTVLPEADFISEVSGHGTRYNESLAPVKRRRVSSQEIIQTEEDVDTLPSIEQPDVKDMVGDHESPGNGQSESRKTREPPRQQRGPFIEESDSDDEKGNTVPKADACGNKEHLGCYAERQNSSCGKDSVELPDAVTNSRKAGTAKIRECGTSKELSHDHSEQLNGAVTPATGRPSLARDNSTSKAPWDDFEGMGELEDEFWEEGEEYMERRWLEEQRMVEEGLDEDSKSESAEDPLARNQPAQRDASHEEATSCPICGVSMKGTTEDEASAHVNGCLDGKSTALPASTEKPNQHDSDKPPGAILGAKRFQRAAIARPGQESPFSLSKDGSSGSVFSKLMSGHAEDAAWAAAAANEVSARGKPAYQRTCPFYKIMPGLYICVDAFRYGKVECQNAYFLSHFHSDHYIGLTSSWCHGPVYCSKVTANLVKRQLKVDPKWVVDLEFERKVEIPRTDGVSVTMIAANHCPGSSLFLFEKIVGRRPNPKVNRILHCGDFRACPAHVNHPLLRPDVVDAVSGKTRQQMIDTCYLDTTYLTPKYAFPSQEDVIRSCAEMCVSLSKEIPDTNDGWERAKLLRAGSGMVKFLEKASVEENPPVEKEDSSNIKEEEAAEDRKPSSRGRLLVVIGTYSIGKERVCLGIAKALNCKIYAPPAKQRICAALEDPELSARLTTNPLEAQVHMQMLMEIRAETLLDYLQGYKSHFSRVVGFRPTGWNYRPPTSRFTENPAVSTVLHSDGWKSRFTMKDLVPQRGSTTESHCFGVPYSEHSSFRELTMFCSALRIGRIIPTVNVGSAKSREKMKTWIEKWEAEKKKSGLFKVEDGATAW